MNDDFPQEEANPYPELNRAAGAGLCLVGTRRHFRRLARETLDAFASADAALRSSGFPLDRPAVYRGFDAAHNAHAFFIADTLGDWDAEDGIPEVSEPTRFPPSLVESPERNRLDDILDGYLTPQEDEDFVVRTFDECARLEFDADRTTAKRLYCISLTWSVDMRHCHEETGWARRQGVFPGSEAAPSLVRLLIELGRRFEEHHAPQAMALRLAAVAAGRIQSLAAAYGRACCAEFEYDTVIRDAK